MLETYEQNSKQKLAATVIAIVVIAGVVLLADHLKSESAAAVSTLTPAGSTATAPVTPAPADTPTGSSSNSSPAASSNSGTYKDGTYSATSDYYVPRSDESIQVNLTLQAGTITNVSIRNSEGDRDSAMFQEDFAASYKNYVVGKKISGLQLRIIAGASDTTEGFNDALNQIARQAQA